MAILNYNHPDIMEFVLCKRKRQITNFNISVAVTEEFMQAVSTGRDYNLIAPHNGEAVGKLNAREVFTEIVESAYQMGVVITNHMIEHNLRDNPADVLIRPAVGKVGLFAFDLAGTAYEMGRAAAQAALPQLEALVYPKTTSRLAAAWKRAAAVIRRQRARQATGR